MDSTFFIECGIHRWRFDSPPRWFFRFCLPSALSSFSDSRALAFLEQLQSSGWSFPSVFPSLWPSSKRAVLSCSAVSGGSLSLDSAGHCESEQTTSGPGFLHRSGNSWRFDRDLRMQRGRTAVCSESCVTPVGQELGWSGGGDCAKKWRAPCAEFVRTRELFRMNGAAQVDKA
jgi:hypothetical protein